MKNLLWVIILLPGIVTAQDKFFEKGMEYYSVSQFDLALENFLKTDATILSETENLELIIKIANCYTGLHSPMNAVVYFEKALALDSAMQAEQKIEYVNVLIESGNYQKAKKILLNMEDGLYMQDILLAKCEYALKNDFSNDNILLLPLYQPTGYSCYGISNVYNKLFYIMHKDGAGFSASNYLFVTEGNSIESFEKLKQSELPMNFNSPCFDSTNNILYFSANASNLKKYFDSKRENQKIGVGGVNNLYIWSYQSELKENDFKVLPFNNIDYSCTHPCITDGGNTMYFSSNMLGGFGGFDLYKVTKTYGKWGIPENLGRKINTFLNDGYPFYKNGFLYFASDGHPGYGGLDIFKINLQTQEIVNLGKPFNSSFDDFSYIEISATDGYFISNRSGINGKDGIFKYLIKD